VSRIGDSSPTGAFAPVFIFPQQTNIVAALLLAAGVAMCWPLSQCLRVFLIGESTIFIARDINA